MKIKINLKEIGLIILLIGTGAWSIYNFCLTKYDKAIYHLLLFLGLSIVSFLGIIIGELRRLNNHN